MPGRKVELWDEVNGFEKYDWPEGIFAGNQVVNVKDFGAVGNGIVDDLAAIQGAITEAKTLSQWGGIVYFPEGNYVVSAPIVLPRSGLSPANIVQLRGAGPLQVRIGGTAAFPTNRALIEWDQNVATRAWFQSISDMSLQPPDKTGTMAIHYKVTDKSTIAKVAAEWMQINLNNLRVYGNNTYHERLIYLEGGQRCSNFTNIYGDPSLNAEGYTTILFEFETVAPSDFGQGADAHGLFMSKIENCHTALIRGGKSALIKGRFLSCDIVRCFCDGGSGTPNFDIYDSSMTNFTNVATEGRNDQPIFRFTDCDSLTMKNISIGTPDDYYGTGLGNGMELINCRDCHFDMRWSAANKPVFSSKGVKVVVIDEDCERCVFTNWTIRSGGDPADEFSILAPVEAGNKIHYYDFQTQASGTIEGVE